jgi:hypothetical protein
VKDDRAVPERVAEIKKMMAMARELEAVRRKYGKGLTGADTTPAEMLLSDLEKDIFGSFANSMEARLSHLQRFSAVSIADLDLSTAQGWLDASKRALDAAKGLDKKQDGGE